MEKSIKIILIILITLLFITIFLIIKSTYTPLEKNQNKGIFPKTTDSKSKINQEERKISSNCGNGRCELGETLSTCPADCNELTQEIPSDSSSSSGSGSSDSDSSTSTCGNEICESSESCSICPQDCGICESRTENLEITVSLGSEEIVFDWNTDRCEDYDLPDVVVKAVRTPNEIVFQSGNDPNNYFSYGPDFNNLERVGSSIHTSGDEWESEKFHAREWVSSVYSEDGQIIHALVHNEYHDPFDINCKPGITDSSNPCWYNSFSYAASTDGGKTFRHSNVPKHVIAFPPIKWDVNSNPNARIPGPYGYFEPSNIVKKDSYYYSTFFAITSPIPHHLTRGTCVMRTNNLSSPSSWRFWDGQGFNGQFKDPYTTQGVDWCAFVSKQKIGTLHGSLTYNTYLEKYMLVGSGAFEHEGNPQTCGSWFALSDDLINWEKPQLLKEGPLGHPPCDNLGYNYIADNYPSVIDHDDTSISFENTDDSFYLYFSRHKQGLDRDLIRMKVDLNKD